MGNEAKIQILDLTITIALFIIACFIGSYAMKHIANTWLAFNGPAIGIFAIGEFLWWHIRKHIINKMENKSRRE